MITSADVPGRVSRVLCEQAVWHEDRCNWVARETLGSFDGRGVISALPPWLYDGLAGVAVFLAAFHAADGDPRAARVAGGATRAALHLVDTKPAPPRGLYAGTAGVSVSAVQVGLLTGAAELVERGAALARDSARGPWDHDDLISGRAGTVLAVAEVARLVDRPELNHAATKAAAPLMAGPHEGVAARWSLPGGYRRRQLTGLAHGIAGPVWALRVLHRSGHLSAAQAARALRAVDAAIALEDASYDARAGNWVDHRASVRLPGTKRFASAWCHGGPGIALSRLGLGPSTDAVRAGLTATTETVLRSIASPIDGDQSLCHGLMGNATILADLADAAPDPGAVRSLAAAAAASHAALLDSSGGVTLGTETGQSHPGLMLGVAGLGLAHLRLIGARTFSATTIGPCQG